MTRIARAISVLVLLAPTAIGQIVWTNRGGIGARSTHAMAYDAARGVVVVFGGLGPANNDLDETWEWDGQSWSQRFPAIRPPARRNSAMVFDSARQRVLLVAGLGSQAFGDTWAWDGSTWTMLAATGPDPRGGHALAYDVSRDRVVLFGGDRGGFRSNLDDTWEWDGVLWSRLAPTASPSPRMLSAMAYDAGRQRLVLTGGLATPASGGFSILGDCYEWDVAAGGWVAGPPLPGVVRGHGMVHDPVGGGVLALGSFSGARPALWHYSGFGWQHIATPTSPAAVSGFGPVFDVRRDRLVAFGGTSFVFPQEATWEWDRLDWNLVSGGPPGSAGYRMVYDRRRQLSVLFGSNVHEWDGRRWTPSTAFPAPSRQASAFGYDDARGQCVRFGGMDLSVPTMVDETWTYDGTAWQLQAPSRSPGARIRAAMAFDETRGTLLLFGGHHITRGLSDDTWEWNGSDWQQLSPAQRPGMRQDHAMVWDRARSRMVLFGGNAILDDTWEWDGSNWLAMTPAHRPPGSGQHGMAYDDARSRVVVFGGGVGNDQVWEWDGTDWQQRLPAVSPPPRTDAAMTYHEARERVVLFGGTRPQIGLLYTDTWELHAEAPAGYADIGAGCAGGGVTPLLVADGRRRPWWGEPWTVAASPLPAATLGAALAVGGSRTAWGAVALPFDLTALGAPTCALRVSIDVTVPMRLTGGRADLTFVVPATPALLGRTLYQQALVVVPGANALHVIVSSARAATIGTR